MGKGVKMTATPTESFNTPRHSPSRLFCPWALPGSQTEQSTGGTRAGCWGLGRCGLSFLSPPQHSCSDPSSHLTLLTSTLALPSTRLPASGAPGPAPRPWSSFQSSTLSVYSTSLLRALASPFGEPGDHLSRDECRQCLRAKFWKILAGRVVWTSGLSPYPLFFSRDGKTGLGKWRADRAQTLAPLPASPRALEKLPHPFLPPVSHPTVRIMTVPASLGLCEG